VEFEWSSSLDSNNKTPLLLTKELPVALSAEVGVDRAALQGTLILPGSGVLRGIWKSDCSLLWQKKIEN